MLNESLFHEFCGIVGASPNDANLRILFETAENDVNLAVSLYFESQESQNSSTRSNENVSRKRDRDSDEVDSSKRRRTMMDDDDVPAPMHSFTDNMMLSSVSGHPSTTDSAPMSAAARAEMEKMQQFMLSTPQYRSRDSVSQGMPMLQSIYRVPTEICLQGTFAMNSLIYVSILP
jgi:hypothetical protein